MDASKLSRVVVLYVGNLQRGKSPGCLKIGPGVVLCVGNLQRGRSPMDASNLDRVCSAVRWQPTVWDGPQDASKLSFVVLCVGNLQRGMVPRMPQNCPL